jgi:SAM-dependent methyltransferase
VTVFAIVLIILFVLDAVRLRGRLEPLEVAPPVEPGSTDGFQVFIAEGATVPDASVSAAIAWADQQMLDVVDLVPVGLPATHAMALGQLLDVGSFRRSRFDNGRTAGAAIIARNEVASRAGEEGGERSSPDLVRLAMEFKRLAPVGMAAVAVTGATGPTLDGKTRHAVIIEALGRGGLIAAMVATPIFLALIGWIIFVDPLFGLLALGAWHLQPLIATAGLAAGFSRIVDSSVGRLPHEIYLFATTFLRPWPKSLPEDPALRKHYADLIKDGTDRFFEPRRDTCPLCEGTELSVRLRTGDRFQHKDGEFTLEKCGGCGHIFQNPRLNIDGLNYYYKDFYDGLGEQALEAIFAASTDSYPARAEFVRGYSTPKTWLDVGGGHGHFSCSARDTWPDTRFDGLDMSESIDEALRRGWVDRGYRGIFPELAGTEIPPDSYDVVSMSHYLEHTREPIDEVAAAARVLVTGGHLMIEVPDPESISGRILNRFWLPFFQPQHQHLVPIGVLERILGEHGFEVVLRHRGEAHQKVDLAGAAQILFGMLSPKPRVPWQPPCTLWREARHVLVWSIGVPATAIAYGIDSLIAPLMRRAGRSNTYRVLARKL